MLLGIIIVIVIIIFIQYNLLIRLKINVQRSKSVIDVYLKQRFDLIPNLIKIVKEYTDHEQVVLEKIIKLRNKYNKNEDFNISQQLNEQIDKVFILAEKYPNLKADTQFLNLQKNLIKIESQLQAARRLYNNDVTKYNTAISIFPLNIIAKIFRFKEEQLFIITESEKDNISVTL